jgi:hypothetical protein
MHSSRAYRPDWSRKTPQCQGTSGAVSECRACDSSLDADKRMGLLVTEAQAREAIARENDDYVINVFAPMTPVPDLPKETIDQYAESLLDHVSLTRA